MGRASLITLAVSALVAGAPLANAGVVTLGSDLSAPATISQAHQADTAFWPVAIRGAGPAIPQDGQITSIRVKGTAIQPSGAPAPLNEIHFQTLDAQLDGTRRVYLSSAPFRLPYTGDANQISTYRPENLCVHAGGAVAFNDEGGWDGTDPGRGPYSGGVPFRVFGSVANSSTDAFVKDNGTKNGMLLAPPTLIAGTELLMQYTLATGDDRSYECGGPLRDAHGKPIPNLRVTPGQDAYVTSDGAFTIFGYCGDARADCTGGTATVAVNGLPVASAPFSAGRQTSIRVPLRLSLVDFARLALAPWTATIMMTTPAQGTATGTIRMHTHGRGALHVVTPQRVYVRGSRVITPAGFCGVPTGCSGLAALEVHGKVVTNARFVTTGKGAIRVVMRVPARVYRQVRKRPLAAHLTLRDATLGTAAGLVLLRH